MSGDQITGALLDAHAPFTAAVPADNFDFWELPEGAGLPSVVGTRISRTEPQFLAGQTSIRAIERWQFTVRANDAEQRKTILKAIRGALRDRTGTIAGIAGVSVQLAGDGPDFKDADAAIYMGSTDARVSFLEPIA